LNWDELLSMDLDESNFRKKVIKEGKKKIQDKSFLKYQFMPV
jgi:hypothetical protein